jgi:hypothetical protein
MRQGGKMYMDKETQKELNTNEQNCTDDEIKMINDDGNYLYAIMSEEIINLKRLKIIAEQKGFVQTQEAIQIMITHITNLCVVVEEDKKALKSKRKVA